MAEHYLDLGSSHVPCHDEDLQVFSVLKNGFLIKGDELVKHRRIYRGSRGKGNRLHPSTLFF